MDRDRILKDQGASTNGMPAGADGGSGAEELPAKGKGKAKGAKGKKKSGEASSKGGGRKAEITRFKGLGEMMPKVLWETTLNPQTRRQERVTIKDASLTERVISDLMGKDPSARFKFIMERAEDAEELDV